MIKILELFGGIGSPRCALRNIGIPVKAIGTQINTAAKVIFSLRAMYCILKHQ